MKSLLVVGLASAVLLLLPTAVVAQQRQAVVVLHYKAPSGETKPAVFPVAGVQQMFNLRRCREMLGFLSEEFRKDVAQKMPQFDGHDYVRATCENYTDDLRRLAEEQHG